MEAEHSESEVIVEEQPATRVSEEPDIPEPAVETYRYTAPGAQYGEVCYSGTPDQWPNFVNPATGCGTILNPDYVEPSSVFVECIYGGGSWTTNALFSDGSYAWHPECQALLDQQMAENPYQCPQTDYFVPDPFFCEHQYLDPREPIPEHLLQ